MVDREDDLVAIEPKPGRVLVSNNGNIEVRDSDGSLVCDKVYISDEDLQKVMARARALGIIKDK